ncbi:MAG: adenylate/guanylate cyclase domain-containing protein, partial [Pseudomonadota bacterium]
MQCHSCGHTVEPDARFCSACGARVRVNCWSCNALIDQAASHCPQCGANQAASQAGSGGSPSNVGIVAEKPAEPEPTASEGEWRQVTILFCDVVGSTKLTEQVDVEDLHELWLTFQHASASVVERYGGHIAKFLGDGFVAYFGYPHAFEDAPHRGALAGLGVLARIGQLNDGEWGRLGIKVRVRQGLHTGVVVAGEMGAGSTRERASIVGMAPNIAARLEAFAQPDTIAVSIDTQRLIGEQFSFEALGRHELAGVDEPVEIFQLLGKKTAPTTIGMAGQESENLIGRVKEVSMLLDAWDSVRQDSRPMIARVVGEPGIGKTAVLGAFLQRAAADPDQLVVLACTNIDRNSAFGPVVTMFQREFGFSLDGEVDEVAERIEEWLTERGLNDERAIGSIVGLLLADRAETTRSNADAREVRREIFAALSAYFSTKKAPLLLVLEDAHWADPSTVELVDWICRRTEQWSGLLLEVSRPESSHPWKRLANITIHMVGLTPEGCENLILQVTDGKEMERRVLDHIVARSDGVPLFVEELTRWVLASGKLIERGGRLRMVGDVASLNVPASLADSLTERLDRLGSGKALAQAAAVPGRDFTFDELSAVADEKGDQLRRSLDQLILAGFLAEIEAPTEAIHQFQHALYRLVAYDSMLRGRRRLLHQRFVEWIDSHPERRAAMRPEILASHCDRAGLQDRAVTLWIEAGERASDASAMIEAERHLTKALDILSDLEQSDDNRTLALKTNVLLGPVLMMNKGTGAAETREVYDRALSLCEGLPQTQWHFPAYWGWWRISDNFKLMRQRAEQLLTVVDDMQEEEYSLEAHHCSWVNSFMVGDHKACIEHVDDGMAIYDGGTFDSLGTLYGGHDPKVCGLGEKALSTWLCGKPDTASDLVEEALDWGEKTNHLGSLLHALDIAIMLRHYLRDTKATRALADRLDWLGRKHELDDYRVKGQIFEGWCLVAEGSAKEGAKQITEALETIRRTVTQEDYPVYFSMHAQAQTALGNVEEAQSILDEGLGLSEKYGMAYWTPELIRQSAETQ